jgi:hypothetical protein
MAWQAKLAHYSCVSRLGSPATIVVHDAEGELLPEWSEIDRTGGTVLPAPSYRVTGRGVSYAPRNTAGTLREAAGRVDSSVDLLLLCDPDVVFARRPRLGRTLCGAACTYLDFAEPPVRAAMKRLGLAHRRLGTPDGGRLRCGSPYLIPRKLAGPLAQAWLEAIDAFPRPRWEDVMYAFGLAVLMLELPLRRVPLADTNYDADAPIRAPVLHYCYDNLLWSKRRFASPRAARRVWSPPDCARPGSILAEILRQLTEARRFYAGDEPAMTRGEGSPV